MASSSKRLQNDVLNYESSSDRKIASNMYYIVCIHLEINSDGSSLAKKLIRQDFEGDGAPLAVYTYFNDVYLVFSSLEESKGEHYLSGSHQKICSYFASSIARTIDMNIICSIVELDSRTKVLVYFQTKIYENAKKSIMVLLKGKKRKEIDSLSMFELLELLKKHAIKWADLPSIERFGMFYKYIHVEGEKGKLSTLSELIDIREIGKYTAYLFN